MRQYACDLSYPDRESFAGRYCWLYIFHLAMDNQWLQCKLCATVNMDTVHTVSGCCVHQKLYLFFTIVQKFTVYY